MYTYETLFTYIAQTVFKDRPITADLFTDNANMLIPSSLLTRLINEGLHIMAIETHCIIDSDTPNVACFRIGTSCNRFTLHDSILHVKEVSITDDDGNFWRICPQHTWQHHPATTAPVPRSYRVGMNVGHTKEIVFDATPTKENLTVRLTVARKSLVEFAHILEGDSATVVAEKKARVSDIPQQYQSRVEYYVADKLLAHRDVDAQALKEWEIAHERWAQSLDEIKREAYGWQVPNDFVYMNAW